MRTRGSSIGAAVALGVLLSGCGSGAEAPPDPLSPEQRAKAVETGEQLDRLFRVITAPSLDHANASQLMARRGEQTAMRECVRAAGYAYGPTFNSGPSWTEEDMDGGFGSSMWLEPPADDINMASSSIDLRAYVREIVPNFRSFGRDVPPQDDPPREVDGRCEGRADAAFKPFPPTRDELYGSLVDMVAAYDRDLDQYHGYYQDCMDDAGFDVTSPDQIHELLQRERYNKVLEPPIAGVGGNEAWFAALRRERAVTAASNECRQPLYESGMYAMAEAVDAWEEEHGEQLTQVAKEWDALLAEARTYPEASQVFVDLPSLLPSASAD